MKDAITDFRGIYGFLSNFYLCDIQYEGLWYPSVENAFQAAKTLCYDTRQACFTSCTPRIAKARGQNVGLRVGWELARLDVMLELVREKFSYKHPGLQRMLVSTGDTELIEGNAWHDTFWGVCNGVGENHLGKILMQVRSEILGEQGA